MPKSVQPLEPLPGHVVLKEYKLEEKIAGRLYVPSDAQNQPVLGEVIAVGDPAKVKGTLVTPTFKVGDILAYKKYTEQELSLQGVKYLLVHFENILAKVNVKE